MLFDNDVPKNNRSQRWGRRAAAAGGLMCLLSFPILFRLHIVRGSSMEPTVFPGDVLVTVAHSCWTIFGQARRNDVVIVRRANDRIAIVKRLVGLPRETVRLTGGELFVNGEQVHSPYVDRGNHVNDYYSVNLTDNQYWVLGDNRSNSVDSRQLGPIRRDELLEHVVLVIARARRQM